jgi:hypothetical protein
MPAGSSVKLTRETFATSDFRPTTGVSADFRSTGMTRKEKISFNVPVRASDAEAVKAVAAADQRSAASLVRKIIGDWVATEGRAFLEGQVPPPPRRQQEASAGASPEQQENAGSRRHDRRRAGRSPEKALA